MGNCISSIYILFSSNYKLIMECSFGITGKCGYCEDDSNADIPITGKDYVILASDMGAGRSIVRMKSDENKLKTLGPHLAMAFSGEPGDTNNFAEYIERNMRLYNIR